MKYLILGAGPAGLSLGCALKALGETSFLILEAEAEAGGLCRSLEVDGSPLDIGGGHFLDTKRKEVNSFLFQFMQEDEWKLFKRDSRIFIDGNLIGHPFESNIWQLPVDKEIRYLISISKSGSNTGKPVPKDFIQWIYWKFGEAIADDYMIPYNNKIFGDGFNSLGTYWLEKLPNASFEDTLRSCLEKKSYGKEPAHSFFLYPKKHGYGELWKRMADSIGEQIEFNKRVSEIDFSSHEVKTLMRETYKADKIICTIPWTSINLVSDIPIEISQAKNELKHSAIRIDYMPDTLDSEAHWIYYPDRSIPYHRILVRSSFCTGSKGYWTETNAERAKLFDDSFEKHGFSHTNEFAYPLNTLKKREAIQRILSFSNSRGIIGLGRWGEWEHYNSDVVAQKALTLAQQLTGKSL